MRLARPKAYTFRWTSVQSEEPLRSSGTSHRIYTCTVSSTFMHVSTSASLPQKSMTELTLERQLILYPMTPVSITSIQFFITYYLPILILFATYAVSMYISILCTYLAGINVWRRMTVIFLSEIAWLCLMFLYILSIFLQILQFQFFLQSEIVFHFFP